MIDYLEFGLTRAWARARLARGGRFTALLVRDDGAAVPVAVLWIGSDGPVLVAPAGGLPEQVPVAALRCRVGA